MQPDGESEELSAAHRIGSMVAELLDDLEEEYGEDHQILDAVIVVEVLPDSEDDGGSIIHRRGTSKRTTVALGLVAAAHDSLLEPYERGDDDGDPGG